MSHEIQYLKCSDALFSSPTLNSSAAAAMWDVHVLADVRIAKILLAGNRILVRLYGHVL
ncbi:hypothetical protein L484_024205 [Morus notabilis]|uniref:Uncharacterized protein n=1 Tax=Morus notabilis TaxID=981085 RepID=W9RME3_9ROSA|nr:hypothetical protein L484_024205 [Morus notabilis]